MSTLVAVLYTAGYTTVVTSRKASLHRLMQLNVELELFQVYGASSHWVDAGEICTHLAALDIMIHCKCCFPGLASSSTPKLPAGF